MINFAETNIQIFPTTRYKGFTFCRLQVQFANLAFESLWAMPWNWFDANIHYRKRMSKSAKKRCIIKLLISEENEAAMDTFSIFASKCKVEVTKVFQQDGQNSSVKNDERALKEFLVAVKNRRDMVRVMMLSVTVRAHTHTQMGWGSEQGVGRQPVVNMSPVTSQIYVHQSLPLQTETVSDISVWR